MHALCAVAPWRRGKSYRGGRFLSGSALGARPEDGGSNPAGADGSVGPPIDPFEYRTGPPVDLSEYRWRCALLHVCVVLTCSVFFLGGGGKNGRDLHGIGGGASC